MKKMIWMSIILGAFSLVGCTTEVVYDDYLESFRYKPESEMRYFYDLGPSNLPVNQSQQIAD